jgi:ATP-dependent Clp protease ATP-binding subunit ClpA
LNEYRKYIEKDGALDRRFQTVMIDPPSTQDTKEILKGLREKYEEHHKVIITDEAIEAAVNLSDRYISGKFQPDKAIDVVDEAGSKVHLSAYTKPETFNQLEDEVLEFTKQKEQAKSSTISKSNGKKNAIPKKSSSRKMILRRLFLKSPAFRYSSLRRKNPKNSCVWKMKYLKI